METHKIDVYAECAFDKVSHCRITMSYALEGNKPPFQYNVICSSYKDGRLCCQKCIAFFACYIDKYGIPKERQVITPDMYPKK